MNGNMITEITGARFPASLEVLYASHNQLKRIPPLSSAKELITVDLSHNKLRELPASISTCSRLDTINVSKNKLRLLPDVFSETVTEIYAENNRLYKMPTVLPMILRILRLDGNKIQTIPPSIMRCTKLHVFRFANNPIIFVPTAVRNFLYTTSQDLLLNPFTNLFLVGRHGEAIDPHIDDPPPAQLYEDPESVHRSHIRKSIWDSIKQIVEHVNITDTPSSEETLVQVLSDDTFSYETKIMINEQLTLHGKAMITGFSLTVMNLFRRVWYLISSSKSIKEILDTDLRERQICYVGFIGRIVSCLVGFVDYVKIDIPPSDQYANIITRVKLNLGDKYTLEEHRNIVAREMEERGATPRTIDIWTSAIS